MVRPVIEYAGVIFDNIPEYLSNQLENLQHRAAIICIGAYRLTEYRALLQELGWETLKERRKNNKLCVYYKILHHIYPDYLFEIIPPQVSRLSEYNLRNCANINQFPVRLNSFGNSFFPHTTKLWNDLPLETR